MGMDEAVPQVDVEIITSVVEVMFSPASIGWFVCLLEVIGKRSVRVGHLAEKNLFGFGAIKGHIQNVFT